MELDVITMWVCIGQAKNFGWKTPFSEDQLKTIVSLELRKMDCVPVVKIRDKNSEAMNIIYLSNLTLWIFT